MTPILHRIPPVVLRVLGQVVLIGLAVFRGMLGHPPQAGHHDV